MDKHANQAIRKKFLFDLNDFGEDAIRKKAEMARRPTFSQDEMAAAQQTGFDQGRVAGLQEAIGSQEAQLRDLCQQIVMTSDRLMADESDRMATFIDQAALIAVQALSKALPVLLNTLAVDQIAGFVNQVLEEQVKSQTIAIYVNPARETAVRERLEAASTAMRRKQSWSIESDPSLHDLQCRIEWTGGGGDWDPSQVANRLLDTITRHLPPEMQARAAAGMAAPAATMDDPAQTPHTESNTSTPEGAA